MRDRNILSADKGIIDITGRATVIMKGVVSLSLFGSEIKREVAEEVIQEKTVWQVAEGP